MKKICSLILLNVMICTFVFAALPLSAAAADDNLALNKNYTVSPEANIENAYPNLVFNDPNKALTDGKKGNSKDIGKNWLSFYRGLSYSVLIDLGDTMYVSGINAGFLNINGYGILAPRTVKFAVSNDGTNFSTVYNKRDDSISYSKKRERIKASFTSDEYYEARYVRIYFTCDVFAYVDEIEILGISSKPADVVKCEIDEPEVFPNEFASNKQEILDGASNIVLIYNGEYYKNIADTTGAHDSENFIPFVSYIDKAGKSVDTLFDSFLFLPLSPGNSDSEGSFAAQYGWEVYLENTIGADDNINLTALDATVGALKEELDLPDDYTVNIFMTVPTITYSETVFGKLDGSTDIIPNTLENAEKIVKWYVDLSEREFKNSNFKNLRLTGFYWYSELVNYSSSPYDVELIKYFTSYCHSREHAAIWIPYYGAPGFWEANELGFDVAALQSGYAFPQDEDSEVGNPKKGTCHDSMSIAKKYGLGVEMELQLVSDALTRYSDYLAQAYMLGCMENGVTMYYQGGYDGEFYNAAKSSDSKRRQIYDLTYKYIKRTYSFSAPYMDENEVTLVIDTNAKRNTANLAIKDDDSLRSTLKVTDLTRPQTGTLSIDGEGFVFFMPEAGYLGKDKFTFRVSDGDNVSELFTVNLVISDKAISFDGIDVDFSDGRTIIYSEGGMIPSVGGDTFVIAVDANGKVMLAEEKVSGVAIPEGGYVIVVSGENLEFARNNVTVGLSAVYDEYTEKIAFVASESSIIDNCVEESSEEASTVENADDKSGLSTLIWIVIAVALIVIVIVAVIIIKHKKGVN